MKSLVVAMGLVLAAAAHAQGNCGKPDAFRNAFNAALTDSHVDVRVTRAVNIEDRGQFGCHLIFDMNNGDQIGGMIVTRRTTDAQWTPDDGRQPPDYEWRVMRKGLILSLADLADAPKPPADPAETAIAPEIRARMDAHPKPVPAFDASRICNSIGAGLPPSQRLELMEPQLNDLLIDAGKVKEQRTATVQKLSAGGMSQKEVDQAIELYRFLDWRARYQLALYKIMTSNCQILWMSMMHN